MAAPRLAPRRSHRYTTPRLTHGVPGPRHLEPAHAGRSVTAFIHAGGAGGPSLAPQNDAELNEGSGRTGVNPSLAALVRSQAGERPNEPALTCGRRRLSFAELDRRSSQVGAALAGAGVGPGDRVAYLGKNSLRVLRAAVRRQQDRRRDGARSTGGWPPPEIAQIVDDSTAAVLVVGSEHIGDHRRRCATSSASIRHVVTLGADDGRLPGSEPFDAWIADHAADDAGHEPAPDDVALQLYTSGTTGLPKGAMLTNRNVWAMLPVTAGDWGFGPDSVNLVTLPNFHVGGVGWALARLVRRRADDRPARVRRRCGARRHRRPWRHPRRPRAGGAPGADRGQGGRWRRRRARYRHIVYGASPISETRPAERSLEAFPCGFIQGYGLTETVGAVIHLLPEDHEPGDPTASRLRSAGRPMDGVEVRVVDPSSGADVPVGTVGEIWLRTPRVMAGYWKQPEATAQRSTADGWLRTGDAGHLDADGYVYLSDRVKDMIISGGENIYPAEVENVLDEPPGSSPMWP